MDEWIDEWMDGLMTRWMNLYCFHNSLTIDVMYFLDYTKVTYINIDS